MRMEIFKIFRLISFSLILTCIFFLPACNEDEFLTEDPLDEIFPENLFTTKTGFDFTLNALNRFVADERSSRIQSNVEAGWAFKLGTDNAGSNTGFSRNRAAGWYAAELNPNFTENRRLFEYLFNAINTANVVIDRAENPDVDWEGGDVTTNELNKNYAIAHAKLVWAWAYRHLTYLWGDVPISLQVIDGTSIRNDWERTPIGEIRNQMEEYLLFAEQHLAETSQDPTRFAKAVARHYLAELYLAEERYGEAIDMAKRVTEDSQYALITERYGVRASEPGVPFMDQFYDGNALPSQGNTEALWSMMTEEDVNGSPSVTMRRGWMTRYDRITVDPSEGSGSVPITVENGGRGLAGHAMTAYAFSVYDDPDDDRFSEYAIRKYWLTTAGDTIFAEMSRDDEPTNSSRNNFRWSHTRKWDGTSADPNNVASGNSFGDQPYLRLAETILILAEAQFMNGDSEAAAVSINQLRTRANAYPITGADIDIEFILDERSRELVTEEHRRHTLNRLGLLFDRTMQFNKGAAELMEPHNILWPIPQSVIDANVDAVFEQNPGY